MLITLSQFVCWASQIKWNWELWCELESRLLIQKCINNKSLLWKIRVYLPRITSDIQIYSKFNRYHYIRDLTHDFFSVFVKECCLSETEALICARIFVCMHAVKMLISLSFNCVLENRRDCFTISLCTQVKLTWQRLRNVKRVQKTGAISLNRLG